MKANTRLFGEIEIADDKIITLKDGIIGFPDLQKFALIYDEEKENQGKIKWLQSMDEPAFALPVIDPLEIVEEYNPTVNDEALQGLGDMTEKNIFILVTITVPTDITKMSINLKAPFIINSDTLQGTQVAVEDELPVKYMIYDLLQSRKAGE